jgi:hypothetical protein
MKLLPKPSDEVKIRTGSVFADDVGTQMHVSASAAKHVACVRNFWKVLRVGPALMVSPATGGTKS